MPDINPGLPIVGQPDSTEEPKVVTALTQLIAAVNNVDTDQIADGTIVTADLGNAAVTAAKVAAWPRVKVHHAAADSIPNSSTTAIGFDTEDWDTDTMFDAAVSSNRVTFKTAGKFRVAGSVEFAGSSGGTYRKLFLVLNGTTTVAQDVRAPNGGEVVVVQAQAEIQVAVNDFLQLQVNQNAGGVLGVNANGYSQVLSADWVGP